MMKIDRIRETRLASLAGSCGAVARLVFLVSPLVLTPALPVLGQAERALAVVGQEKQPPAVRPQPDSARVLQSAQSLVARQAALVTEFEVNGLKVLLKRREGSLTVAAGLFIKGGSRNINAENAGIESLMLDVSTEASAAFPRDRMRDG